MEREEWLEKVRNPIIQLKLKNLVANYHPSVCRDFENMPITAPNAEKACENIRKQIKEEEVFKGDVRARFDEAIKVEDINSIYEILNATWFGVPESTQCWSIEGFSEAVELLEDPPEMDFENESEEV